MKMDYRDIAEKIRSKVLSNIKTTGLILAGLGVIFLIVWLSSSYSYNKALKRANKENREKIDSIQETKAKIVTDLYQLEEMAEAKDVEIIIIKEKNKQLQSDLKKIQNESQTIKNTYFNSSIAERVKSWAKLTKGN